MKLEKYKEDSYEFSKQASELIRQFAFAGIAVIWIFKAEESENTPIIPTELIWPLLLLVGTLVFDLFQYLIPTIIWTVFYRVKEKRVNPDEDIKAPAWLSFPGWICFTFKTISLLIGYYFLVDFMISKIPSNG